MSDILEIDGSYSEAGGQIARTAVALAAVTGKSCHIFNIRKGRKEPGLKAQHLKGIEACAKLCNAELIGAKIGSTEIKFVPKEMFGGKLKIDVGTAGSIILVLQTLVVPSLYAKKKVELEIIGGTDVKWSPPVSYFQHIFCDFLKRMGVEIKIETQKYGFYPNGGGRVTVSIKPCKKLKPLILKEKGAFQKIDVCSIASEELKKARVCERQIEGFKKILIPNNSFVVYVQTLSPGSSVHAHAHFENCKLGADSLGERGKPAEKVGEECASLLKKQIDSGACLDEWMADQILPFAALACKNGESLFNVAEVTKHSLTNAWIIEKFLPVKFKIDEKHKIISCASQ